MLWRNWSGHVACEPKMLRRPSSADGVAFLVKEVRSRGGKLRVVGSGHSFTPLVVTNDTLVSLDELSGVASVDATTQRAVVRAGTKIHALGPALASYGIALLNQGDIHEQALAGAVSTGTHGTGIELGSLSSAVQSLTLVDGRGQLRQCSPTSQPELFRFARLGLGSLGVMTQIEMQCRPVYKLRETKRNLRLDEALEDLPEAIRRHRHYEFFWFPYSDSASIKALDPTDAPVSTSWIKQQVQEAWLENAAWAVMCEAARLRPALNRPTARFAAASFSEAQRVDWSWKIFPNPRWVRFNEMEYAVPVDAGPDCLRDLRAMIEREQMPVNFPIEYRFVAADDIPLSPFYKRDSAVLSVHAYHRTEFRRYFDACETIFRRHDGRPHWGKMHSLAYDDLKEIYPALDEFAELRRELDPDRVFCTPYTRKLFEDARRSRLRVVA